MSDFSYMNVVNKKQNRIPNDEQLIAINFPYLKDKTYMDKNILVSAAAGSGKTWVLTERIIKLLTREYQDEKDEVTLQDLLVMTFTIKATKEMRKKIKDALENAIKEKKGSKLYSKLIRESAMIQNANITTIDSFCKNILEENYVELDEENSLYGNFDPSYKVIDGEELDVIYDDCIDFLLDKYYSSDKYKLLFVYYIEKGFESKFKDMCIKVLAKLGSIPWPHEYLQNKIKSFDDDCKKAVDEYVDLLNGELRELQNECNDIIKRMYSFFDYIKDEKFGIDAKRQDKFIDSHKKVIVTIEKFRDLKLDGKEFTEFYNDIENMPKIPDVSKNALDIDKTKYTVKKENFKADRDKIFSYLRANYDVLTFTKSLQNDKKLREKYFEQDKLFLEFIDELYIEVVKEKKKKNVIYVSDFASLSLDILYDKKIDENGFYVRTISERAKDIASKYKYIFIDEYQDTNSIQEFLLKALSDDFKSQNVFMVGDLKQSIYGFRSSKPSIFADKFDIYTKNVDELDKKDGFLIDLSTNYRCSSNIINFVNAVFSRIMNRDFGRIDYINEGMLKIPDDKNDKDAPKVDVNVIYDGSKEQDGDKTTLEAEFVAGKILELVKTHKYDYKDIVILHRAASTIADTFCDVFSKYGIPVYAEQKSGFFKSEEIMLMVDILNIVDNPYQNIAVLNILTSNLYLLTNEELAFIKVAYTDLNNLDVKSDYALFDAVEYCYNNIDEFSERSKEYKIDFSKLEQKIKSFYNNYQKLSFESRYKSISDMISEIYDTMHIKNIFSSTKNGKLKTSNLDKLYSFAKNYENSSYVGLFNFLRYIEKIDKLDDDQGQAKIFDENDDVVNIMTIHQSKGLEFKYVFLCGCGKKYNINDFTNKNTICFYEKYGVSLKYFDLEKRYVVDTPKRDLVKSLTKDENLQEELRLLYVALTRAKIGLSVVAFANKNKIQNFSVEEMNNLLNEREQIKNGEIINYKVKDCDTYIDLLLKFFPDNEEFCTLSYTPVTYTDLPDNDDISYDYANLDSIVEDENVDSQNGFLSRFNSASLTEAMLDTYKLNYLQSLRPKFSVTAIKAEVKRKSKDFTYKVKLEDDSLTENQEENNEIKQNKDRMDGTEIGTAYHRYMQYYNYALNKYDTHELKDNTIESVVNEDKIVKFKNTDLGKRFEIAYNNHSLYREQKFMKLFSDNEINNYLGKGKDENKISDEPLIIIQGIIDAFFVEKDLETNEEYIVLVDYKTDKINQKLDEGVFTQYLIDNYKVQLEIYKDVLESITGLKVRECYIYSFALDKDILVK